MDYKQLMLNRVSKRKDKFLAQYNKIVSLIERDKVGGEANRLWVEKQIIGLKKGLDICCGEFLVGEEGVDQDPTRLGPVWYYQGDALNGFDDNALDYIVTNYIEAFIDIMKALREWHRALKPGGILAFSCANADKYVDDIGPLVNPRRNNIFTPTTIKQYLTKAGFVEVIIEDGETLSMRVKCKKKN